jgi:hypothetical protein
MYLFSRFCCIVRFHLGGFMSKAFFLKLTLFSVLSLNFLSTVRASDIVVTRDEKYIYYKSSWSQMTKNQQIEVVDASIDILKDELSILFPSAAEGLKKTFNKNFDLNKLDDLVLKAQNSVKVDSQMGIKSLLPSGLMILVGGAGSAAVGPKGGFSGYIGLVLVPVKVTRVNIEKQTSVTYATLDWQLVAIPNAKLGAGVGAGGSVIVGASLIFGNLASAKDFMGYNLALSGKAQFASGVEGYLSIVHNQFSKKNFILASLEYHLGVEAQASVNGNFGYILPLKTVVSKLLGDVSVEGETKVLLKDKN